MSQFPPPQSPAQPGWGAPPPEPSGPQPWGPGAQGPQGPQAGWGQQAPPKKGGGAAVGIILALVGIGAAAAAFFLLGGKDDANSPEGTVRAMVDASNAGDCDRAAELVTANMADLPCTEEPDEATVDSIETQSEEGDNAVVVASITNDGTTVDYTFQLVRVDGDWKIDGMATGAPSGGGSGEGASGEESAGESSDGGESADSGSSDGGESADGGSSSSGASGSPEDTVIAMIDAGNAGDCDAVAELATESAIDDLGGCDSSTDNVQVEDITTVSEGGGVALVEATLSADGQTASFLFELSASSGQWMVESVQY